jgi:serine/threonine-protein kinase
MIGKTLKHYRIESHLGAGGMGDVYRARDSKLKREVAIKVLPEAFSRDAERVLRFQREAEVLASLNHPHIAAIYDVEEVDDSRFLVLEFIEGQTLCERLTGDPLAIDETLAISIQIAEALEAAHEKGIIHRDLKPANIKLSLDGVVKVLDFGLAKIFGAHTSEASSDDSPTLLSQTGRGVLMGTAAYMSPEQARGRSVDRSADIWALGCILYEMLSGQQAFGGETMTDILGGIVKGEPDWSALPKDTPPRLAWLIRRCLNKNSKDRLRDAGDVRILLQDLSKDQQPTNHAIREKAGMLALAIAFGLGLVIAGVAAWTLLLQSPPGASVVARLTIPIPPGDQVAGLNLDNPMLAISADGTQLAYIAVRASTQQLFIRAMDGHETNAVPGTEAASNPFFSPDGQWIGFFAGGKLKKVSVAGSVVQVVCDAPNGRGGSWAADDNIYFAPDVFSGIWKVHAAGGMPQEVTKLEPAKGEVSHRWPQLLPGARALLFTIWTGPGSDERLVAVQSLETGERQILVRGGESGQYAVTGHLLYARADTLMALRFDVERLEVTSGPAVPLGDRVRSGSEGAQFALSDQGTLVYMRGDPRRNERRLVWVDRQGKVEPLPAPPRTYANPQISLDGRFAAVEVQAGTIGIWLYDFSRAALRPLTFSGSSQSPVWSPDGKRVAYRGTRMGFRNLFWKLTDGSGEEEERLSASPNVQTPASWSPDGKWLAYFENVDLWVLPLEGERKPQTFVSTPFTEFNARFSPDGRWIAYSTNESGRLEIYVRPFPGPGTRTQVSTDGGYAPVWAPDGRELFYVRGDQMLAVQTTTQPVFRVGTPRILFEGSFLGGLANSPGYDVSPDGRRFLRVQAVEPEKPATQIDVSLNWFEELKRRVP